MKNKGARISRIGGRPVWASGVVCLMAGCSGPVALERAIRPEDEKAYMAAVADDDPKGSFLRWRASEEGVSVEAATERDDALVGKNPFERDDRRAISLGAVIYQYHCLRCHGEDADGNGPRALADHGPENFRSAGERFKVSLGGIPKDWFEAVAEGEGPEVEYPEGRMKEMPAFGEKLSNEQIWMVLTYLASSDDSVPKGEAPDS